jgi:Isoprenylcysteine carboxyl methyltransferase (ICMT) family
MQPVMDSHYLIEIPWLVFVAYWAVGALKTRATVRQESFTSRYGVLLLEILGFVLLFSDNAGIGPLGRHFLPRTLVTALVGVAFTWIGIGIALWAPYNLGQYWSARITLKEDHQLIRTGPYAYLRHPIYTGLDRARHRAHHRPLEMRGGSMPDHYGLCDQGEEGRIPAGRAIRASFRRTQKAHRFPASAFPMTKRQTTNGRPC